MNKPTADDDPTRVLDGWSAPSADPAIDPTRVLDNWNPRSLQDRRRPDPSLPLVEQVQPLTKAVPYDAAPGVPADLDLRGASRHGKWDNKDVTDVEAVVLRSADFGGTQGVAADASWTPQPSRRRAQTAHPRLLDAWQAQAWIGAVKPVFGSVAQVVSTPDGPVVDTFAPHVLLALWRPQSPASPFLERWPERVTLSAVKAEEAGLELLEQLPADALLWLAEHDLDWALIGEAVLLHEPNLRDFQLKELRAFVEAEKQANFDRLNAAYTLPGEGQPLRRI